MKKIVFLISLIFVSYSSQAISLDTLANKTISTVDSIKASAVNTANQVDTSRLSKQIYADFKQALAGIASALRVGVEHVYKVLVKQQIVKAIQWTILGIIPIIFLLVFGKSVHRWAVEYWDETDGFVAIPWLIFFGLCIFGLFEGITHIDTIVTGFVNPEYGAMEDIMEFVKKLKY